MVYNFTHPIFLKFHLLAPAVPFMLEHNIMFSVLRIPEK